MVDVGIGRTLRALRLRARASQATIAERAGISQTTWSRIERGHLGQVSLTTIRGALAAVDARLELSPSWRGGAIDRLRDEGHSALVGAIVARLESLGWECAVEVTYSEFGERGSIDVLAVHAGTRIALIVEVKTSIASQEEMLRKLDEKARLGPKISSTDSHGGRRLSAGCWCWMGRWRIAGGWLPCRRFSMARFRSGRIRRERGSAGRRGAARRYCSSRIVAYGLDEAVVARVWAQRCIERMDETKPSLIRVRDVMFSRPVNERGETGFVGRGRPIDESWRD